MNKQVVMAGLLGAASAADCADQFTAATQEILDALLEQQSELGAATEGLEEACEVEALNVENATGNLESQASLIAPFQAALDEAATNWYAQSEAKQEAVSLLSSLGDDELTVDTTRYTARQALDASQGVMTGAQEAWDTQDAAVTKLLSANSSHATEVVTLTKALEDANTAEEAAISAYGAAEAVKAAFVEERAVAETGQAAVLVTKGEEYTAAEEAYGVDEGEEGEAYTPYKAAKLGYDKKVKEMALIQAACTFTETISGASETPNCASQASDPIGVIKSTADGGKSALETTFEEEEEIWVAKVTDTATAQVAMEKAKRWKEIATTNDEAVEEEGLDEDSNIATALETQEAATEARETAESDLSTGESQAQQAGVDLARGEDILADLLAVLTPLKDDYVVKTYLLAQQNADFATQTDAKNDADGLLADLATLEEMAEETVDRATTALEFYTLRLGEATASQEVADGMLAMNLGAKEMIEEMVEEATEARDASIASCKGDGYDRAQVALAAKLDKTAEEDVIIEEVKDEYDLESAMPNDGTAGTLCNFPVRTSLDEDVGDRPICNEGLCCGAAQKFMKDGTKLAIETCQTLEGTRTYQYYPPLPARAVVAPAVETWRFQCISGAQKLAAAASAALVASYMMA